MKSVSAAVLSFTVCLLLIFTSCSDSANTGNKVNSDDSDDVNSNHSQYIGLAFSSNDSLNPYEAVTKENQEIATLLFDPLVFVDNDFHVEYKLASNVECDGTTCTIKLRRVICSDGKQITAEDVIYSVEQIFETKRLYFDQISNIDTYRAVNSNTVELTLKTYDPYFVNNLDFPIIQQDSSDLKDENKRQLPPIGCGKYIFINENGDYHLEANPNYYSEIKCKKIDLVNCPDKESLHHAASVGAINYMYTDLSDHYLPNFSGIKTRVNTNNLVFIGINSNSNYLNSPEFRHMVSYAVDRSKIVQDAYFSYAESATGLFNPHWEYADDFFCFQNTAQSEKVIAYFNQLGYNKKDKEGYYLNTDGERFKFQLLYNSDNTTKENTAKIVYRSLVRNGIEVDLVGLPYDKYIQRLTSGNYDMYIGEVRILQSMSLYDAFMSDKVFFGLSEKSTAKKAFLNFYSGDGDFGLAMNAFHDELPFIPLCYRYGVAICSKIDSQNALQPSANYVYNGIENITITE